MTLRLLLICAIVSAVQCDSNWDYLIQNDWASLYPSCGGHAQSPVDLQDVCLPGTPTRVNESLRVNLINYNTHQTAGFTFTNNGHSAELSLNGGQEKMRKAPKITGSAANGQVYQFSQLHFHWDQNDTQGSEHSFHGIRRALEMHLVHWNVKYGNFANASSKPDGLLVFAVLFQAGIRENDLLNPIVDRLQDVVKFGSKVTINEGHFTLASLLPPSYQIFYRYRGSLTTPPCSESVNWLIIAELENIGYSQLLEFAKLDNRENRAIGNTNRVLQPLNGRLVEASSNEHCSRSTNRGREPMRRPSGHVRILVPPPTNHTDTGFRQRVEKWFSKWI